MSASLHNHQKKIAVVNDITGFGRCSIAVALPIISVMGVQCCPLPTSILSDHTGFESYFFDDYTDRMPAYINEWRKLGLSFRGINTGFLGSCEQIDIVMAFISEFADEDTVVVVDPVMGDYGRTYATYTPEMCSKMKHLAARADILTPNLTEACILTDTPWHEGKWTEKEVRALTGALHEMGPGKIVITGIQQGHEYIANYCFDEEDEDEARSPFIKTHRVGTSRSGTGDIFSAIAAADAVNGVPFRVSVKKASRFIKKCIERSIELDIPLTDGVCFEEVLRTLK